MIKTKVDFLEGRLLSSQSDKYEKFLKTPDWLEKNRPSKKATFVLCKQDNNSRIFSELSKEKAPFTSTAQNTRVLFSE